MCTVTFIARRNGYALGMNRDEKLTRPVGLPPRRMQLRGRIILAPSEPSGGTWIGVNDTGVTLALINWYSITTRVTGNATSRGDVVKACLSADSPAAVEKTIEEQPLSRVNPFRLIGIFPADRAVIEWRWNLDRLEPRAHRWQTNTWISSGFDEPGAQHARDRTFREVLCHKSAGSLNWLRRLHRSHGGKRGPHSHCMHRADAESVSYTEISVSRHTALLRYIPGTPCSNPSSVTSYLRFKHPLQAIPKLHHGKLDECCPAGGVTRLHLTSLTILGFQPPLAPNRH
jgi:hypothetical protein